MVEPVVHKLTNTSVGRTVDSEDSHLFGGIPTAFSRLLARPTSGLNIHIQIAPMATMGMMDGR